MSQNIRLISKKEALKRIGVSPTTLWNLCRKGLFPLGRVVGGKVYFLEHEIEAWIAGLPVQKLKGYADPTSLDSRATDTHPETGEAGDD